MFCVSYKYLRHLKRCSFPTSTQICRGRHKGGAHDVKPEYDVVVIGAGHNGLISAAYLQKAGLNVCVLEKRHVIGGSSVTEEIIPGFKFSRASYVLSLLRPRIVEDLELKKYGLKVYLRNPNSYTPLLEPGGKDGKATSLLLGRSREENRKQIAQFSHNDAKVFGDYEDTLERIVTAIEPLLDTAPISIKSLMKSSLRDKWETLPAVKALLSSATSLGRDFPAFYAFMTAPAQKILDQWFESEPLKATLATDSVIGAMMTPSTPGSGYVLLHHVMGELEGIKGAWGYVKGGMGGLSQAIANCAEDRGASIFMNKTVSGILHDSNLRITGVVLKNGTEVKAKVVLSNATPKVTFLDLLPEDSLPADLRKEIVHIDYKSPVTKINVAVNKLPNFTADPNHDADQAMPHHQATIHLNCEHSQLINDAYLDCQMGHFPNRPMIEMTIPSTLDPTLAPAGCHVVLLFTQYTPYHLANSQTWDEQHTNEYADIVFQTIEKYAPGFEKSVIGRDVLSPPDLERVFGLTGGNIFHGSMSLDQLYMARPNPAMSNYRTPLKGLYLCGSGTHPGGGVMGSPGRLSAESVLADYKTLK